MRAVNKFFLEKALKEWELQGFANSDDGITVHGHLEVYSGFVPRLRLEIFRNGLALSFIHAYQTLSDMNGNGDAPDNYAGLVFADTTGANNILAFRKAGSWVASTTFTVSSLLRNAISIINVSQSIPSSVPVPGINGKDGAPGKDGVIGPTTTVTNWNETRSNGNYRSSPNATFAPEATQSYYGYVRTFDDGHGTQQLWTVGASDLVYEREFYLVGSTITFSPWVERRMSLLIDNWNFQVKNGNYRSMPGAVGAPEGIEAYYGHVVNYDDSNGMQRAWAVGASDLEYRREFYLSGGSLTFGPWLLVGGTVLITDWNITTKNGNYRSAAGAVGAPDSTNAYYGTVDNYDNNHGTQKIYTLGATGIAYEREFYLANDVTTFSPWSKVLKPDEIIEYGSTANGHYVKYSNGVLECWTTIDHTGVDWTTLYGGLYTPGLPHTWNYPAFFANDPTVFGTANRFGVVIAAGMEIAGVAQTFANLAPWICISSPAGSGKSIHVMAKGRWF